jgi:cytochrome b561
MADGVRTWSFSMRLIHWATAALVVGAGGIGAYAVGLVQNPAQRFDLTQTHKSIGLTVFALTAIRSCLRVLTTAPKPAVSAPRLLLRVARATHITLYALLLLLPSTGWLMATTTVVRVPTTFFGFLELPYILAPDLLTYRLAHAAHAVAAIALAFLIAVHIGAAMVHALWWRDDTMAQMSRDVSIVGRTPETLALLRQKFFVGVQPRVALAVGAGFKPALRLQTPLARCSLGRLHRPENNHRRADAGTGGVVEGRWALMLAYRGGFETRPYTHPRAVRNRDDAVCCQGVRGWPTEVHSWHFLVTSASGANPDAWARIDERPVRGAFLPMRAGYSCVGGVIVRETCQAKNRFSI